MLNILTLLLWGSHLQNYWHWQQRWARTITWVILMRPFRVSLSTDVGWKLQGQWICFLYHFGSVKLFCGHSVFLIHFTRWVLKCQLFVIIIHICKSKMIFKVIHVHAVIIHTAEPTSVLLLKLYFFYTVLVTLNILQSMLIIFRGLLDVSKEYIKTWMV